jgi:hypothetical protein
MPHLERAEAALALLPPRGSRDLLFGQSASGFNITRKLRSDCRITETRGKPLAPWTIGPTT